MDVSVVNAEKETALDIARRRNDVTMMRALQRAARRQHRAPSTLTQRIREDDVTPRQVARTLAETGGSRGADSAIARARAARDRAALGIRLSRETPASRASRHMRLSRLQVRIQS